MLAIGGLDTAILKSATLTDSPEARPLAPMLFQVGDRVRFPTELDGTLQRQAATVSCITCVGGELLLNEVSMIRTSAGWTSTHSATEVGSNVHLLPSAGGADRAGGN